MSDRVDNAGIKVILDLRSDELLIATISGDLGIHGSEKFERLTTGVAPRRGLVVLNLAGVDTVSSLGLGVLVALQRGIRLHGGRVRLARVQPRVMESFQRARLDSVFENCATMEEAVGLPSFWFQKAWSNFDRLLTR